MQKMILIVALLHCAALLFASCPEDHLKIGRNPDGIFGTDDDVRLYIDVTEKYRRSDPLAFTEHTWLNWHYPLFTGDWGNQYYSISQPGFGQIGNDPNHSLTGTPNTDYQIWLECLSISPNLQAVVSTQSQIRIENPGDAICHSCLGDHWHLTYRVPAAVADPNAAYHITFRAVDSLGAYLPSEPVTIFFMNPPLDGDLVTDGIIDLQDLIAFFDRWMEFSSANRYTSENKAAYDLFERADMNRDYRVDFFDFAILARNWLAAP